MSLLTIDDAARKRQIYIAGIAGTGKTTLLEQMFLADVAAGHGVGYIDKYGDVSERVLPQISAERKGDVVFVEINSSADIEALPLAEIFNTKKILLVNILKSRLDEVRHRELVGLFMEKIIQTVLGRIDTPEEQRSDFFLHLDEVPMYNGTRLWAALSEFKKFHVYMTLAHQYLDQLDAPLLETILGYTGTQIFFRLGQFDAEELGKKFFPNEPEAALAWVKEVTGLKPFQVYANMYSRENWEKFEIPQPTKTA